MLSPPTPLPGSALPRTFHLSLVALEVFFRPGSGGWWLRPPPPPPCVFSAPFPMRESPRTNTFLVLGAAPRFRLGGRGTGFHQETVPVLRGGDGKTVGDTSRAHLVPMRPVNRGWFSPPFSITHARGMRFQRKIMPPSLSPNPPGVAFRGAAPLSTGQRRPYGEGWDGCLSGAPFVFLLGPPGLKIDSVTSWDGTQACTPKQRITPRG